MQLRGKGFRSDYPAELERGQQVTFEPLLPSVDVSLKRRLKYPVLGL